MVRPRQCTVTLVFVVIIFGAVFFPWTATAESADTADQPPADRSLLSVSQEDGQENNSSTQHENPSEASEEGDTDGVSDWLTNRLADQLGDSTIQLSEGEYDAAREAVGDDYSDRLGQLVEVEGETEGAGDEWNDSATFEQAQENQQEFVSSVQQYRETRERYQEARQNGNETEARRLARRLDQIAQNVNTSGSNLVTDYRGISNGTERELAEQSQTVGNITENVTGTQREIREEEFVEAALSVERQSADVSFRDPLAVTGQLTSVNGTAIDGETIELQLGNETSRVTTNATGDFSVTLRPTVQRLDTQNATVRFVPSNASVYLGTNENVSVEIDQVTPTVTLAETPSEVTFNESVTVAGSVSVDDEPVGAVPVEVRLGGERLGQTQTNEVGEFSLTTRLPATVSSGDQQINASLPFRRRALSSTGAERGVVVRETDTSVTISASQNGTERVNATGWLTTADGTPVADQRIELRVNGSVVETVRTNENGRYETSVPVPSTTLDDDGSGLVRIAAVYSTDRTNLADARATTVVTISGPSDRSQLLPDAWRRIAPIVLVVATAAVVGGLLWHRRRAPSSMSTTDDSATGTGPAVVPEPEDSPADLSLKEARAALNAGRTNRAVELAYGDVRRGLFQSFDSPTIQTHWEFYQACKEAELDGETVGLVKQLTEAYERAAYAPEDFSEPEVEALLDAVEAAEIPVSH